LTDQQRSTRRFSLLFALCLAGLTLSFLTGVALVTNRQARTRGISPGLPQPITGADVSPFCINAPLGQYEEGELEWVLDVIAAGGFDWVRMTFPWSRIEPAQGAYDWAMWDSVVDAASARDIALIAVLDTAPEWAGTPPPPADFARFAGAFAARYGDRIDAYQIWNNPNLADGWGAHPNAAAYARLLEGAAETIRQVDPEALILLGGLAPTVEQGPENLSEIRFLRSLYTADAAPYFDILTVQPYGFDTGPEDRQVHESVLNFSRAVLIREEMVAQGDGGKAVWASHFGWNSLPAGWSDVASIWGEVDEMTQADYTVGAVERARQEWAWMGTMCLSHFQPDTGAPSLGSGTPNAERHWGFAAATPEGEVRPVFEALAELAQGAETNTPGAYTPLSGVADWEGEWEFSDLGADVSEAGGDQVTIPFWGSDLGLRVRRGNYRGMFYVTVDGEPANGLPQDTDGQSYLILTSPDYEPEVITIPVAENLPAGQHVAVVRADRGWDQWALAGWSVGYHPDDVAYPWSLAGVMLLGLGCLVGAVVVGRRVAWGSVGRVVGAAWGRVSRAGQLVIAALTTVILWLAAWMTWGVEAGNAFRRLGDGVGITATLAAAGLFYYSPWFLLTLVAGLALFILILLRVELGLALIVALVPFYAFPWELFSKAFSMAEIVTLMTVVSWAVRRIANFEFRYDKMTNDKPQSAIRRLSFPHLSSFISNLDLGVIFLVAVALFTTPFASFQRVAWRELRLVIIEPALFYMMVRTAKLERRDLWRILDAFVLGGVAVAVIGLAQYVLGVNLITAEAGISRLRSVYGSPNNVGLYLGRVLPLLVAIALFARRCTRRWLYAVAVLPVAAALLLSFSKGAILLGIPAAIVTIGLLAGGRWLWVTLGGIVTAGVAAVPLLRHPRFASLLDTQGGTTFFRLKLWQATARMIRDHPLIGVGLDNFLYLYRGRYILPEAWQEPDLSHPHNILLDHWVRLGIFGVVVGVWLQAAFWRITLPLRKLRDPDGRALALGLMGVMADMLAHGLVDHSFFLIDLAFAFFLILAMAKALASGKMADGES
jgi:O-antigen ligase